MPNPTRAEIESMTPAELNRAIAEAYCETAMRLCYRTPDCGEIDEVQTLHEKYPEFYISDDIDLEERKKNGLLFEWPCFVSRETGPDDDCETITYTFYDPVPDWSGDIRAAFELEGEIPVSDWERYTRWLKYCVSISDNTLWTGITSYHSACPEDKIPQPKLSPHIYCLIHATAEERCRAYLLWKST